MKKAKYPLEDVIGVKKKRVKDQEKAVAEANKRLEKEQETLKEREKERDTIKNHFNDKMSQMRREMDEGTTSPKIQQMKAYVKVVFAKVEVEEKKVKEQKERVDHAEKELKDAKELLKKRKLEVDKLEKHKEEWLIEAKKEFQIQEIREQDELGSLIYNLRKRRGW